MRVLLFILLLFIVTVAWTDVYKSIDAQGNVVYSDAPLNDQAEKIDLPQDHSDEPSTAPEETPAAPPPTSTQAAGANADNTTTANKIEKKPYTAFDIASPPNGATLQNQPIILVEISVTPDLQEGDKIQIYLDGNAWGAANHATQFELPRPERGTHQISAKLFDNKNTVLRESGSHTVFIHQAHIPTSLPVRQ